MLSQGLFKREQEKTDHKTALKKTEREEKRSKDKKGETEMARERERRSKRDEGHTLT